MDRSTGTHAGRQAPHLRLIHSSPVWHRPGPHVAQDFAEALAAVPDAWDALALCEQPSLDDVRSALSLAKAIRRQLHDRLSF